MAQMASSRSQSDPAHASQAEPSTAPDRGSVRLRSLRGDYHVPHYDLWKRRHRDRAVADVLRPGGRVFVLGSCFADEVVDYLNRRGYTAESHPGGELYNPASLRAELEHVVAGNPWPFDIAVQTPDGVEHRLRERCRATTREDLLSIDAVVTQRVRDLLEQAELLIIIVGTTTEVWRDQRSGLPTNKIPHPKVFERGGWYLDPGDVEDICADVTRIQDLLSEHSDTPQVYTVCPVPLYATWLDIPVAAANGRGKALLRTALERSLRDDSVYLDMWDWVQAQAGRRLPVRTDGRHFTASGLDQIMMFTETRLSARKVPKLSARHRARSRIIDLRQRARYSRAVRGFRFLRRALGR